MLSEANATGTEDLGFDGDVEAAEPALKTRGVQDYEGAAGDLATPRLLPVQQLVEPNAPLGPSSARVTSLQRFAKRCRTIFAVRVLYDG